MKTSDPSPRLPLLVLILAFCAAGTLAAEPTSAPVPVSAAISSRTFPTTCFSNASPGDSTDTYGSFTVSSNIWNPGAATAYKQCTSATIQSPGGVTAAEFDWNFTSTNSEVKTYPNLQFGQQNDSYPSTTPLLPVAIAKMPSLNVTGTITTVCATAAPCYFDSGFDVFFSRTLKPTNLIEGELMIITSYHFAEPLGGWAATNVSIGSGTYNLRQFEMKSGGRSWSYVAYYATSPITRIDFNIKDFVMDAVRRGYIPASYYVDMVEIGTEALSGHGITRITNYNIQ